MSSPRIIRSPTQARLVNTDVRAKPLVEPMAVAKTPPKPMTWYVRLWRKCFGNRRRTWNSVKFDGIRHGRR